jgi:hypothetical protein
VSLNFCSEFNKNLKKKRKKKKLRHVLLKVSSTEFREKNPLGASGAVTSGHTATHGESDRLIFVEFKFLRPELYAWFRDQVEHLGFSNDFAKFIVEVNRVIGFGRSDGRSVGKIAAGPRQHSHYYFRVPRSSRSIPVKRFGFGKEFWLLVYSSHIDLSVR